MHSFAKNRRVRTETPGLVSRQVSPGKPTAVRIRATVRLLRAISSADPGQLMQTSAALLSTYTDTLRGFAAAISPSHMSTRTRLGFLRWQRIGALGPCPIGTAQLEREQPWRQAQNPVLSPGLTYGIGMLVAIDAVSIGRRIAAPRYRYSHRFSAYLPSGS
jgi:hypothetical protein